MSHIKILICDEYLNKILLYTNQMHEKQCQNNFSLKEQLRNSHCTETLAPKDAATPLRLPGAVAAAFSNNSFIAPRSRRPQHHQPWLRLMRSEGVQLADGSGCHAQRCADSEIF